MNELIAFISKFGNELIDLLTKLGGVPSFTIPFGTILGIILAAFVNYLFIGRQKKAHDEQVTKQVLSFVNMEISKNIATFRTYSRYPYQKLSLRGLEFIITQAGNTRINNGQLAKINVLYILFDEINKNILSIREEYSNKNLTLVKRLAKELKEIQKICVESTDEYIRKYITHFE